MKSIPYLVLSLCLFAVACGKQESGKAETPRQEAPRTEGPRKITSEEDAQKAAVGVWTYTEPLNSMVQMIVGWNKYDFKADGSCEHFRAAPADNNWGKAEKCKWEAYSGKYMNTGERYYGIKEHGSNRPFIFRDTQNAEYRDVDGSVLAMYHKGDAFPFSK